MRMPKKTGVVCAAMLIVALATLGLAGSASAKLVGEFEKFKNCPYTNPEAQRCIVSVTESGEVVLGSKKVPIEKPVTLQGGYTEPVEGISKFIAPTSGEALSKAPQNVPGGLLGIVPEEKQPFLVKKLIKFFFENSLTGVNSTLELAKPASEIRISESALARKEEVALKMPVRVHLENPFLGKNCFVGSSSSPITFALTTGITSPPKPNEPIEGSAGKFQFREGGRILHLAENKLVDNAWSAPAATGCGGLLSFLVTPIINGQLGTTTAGHNAAILNNTVDITSTAAAKTNNEENP